MAARFSAAELRRRRGAGLVVLIAVAVLASLALRRGSEARSQPERLVPAVTDPAGLRAAAAAVNHPLYWVPTDYNRLQTRLEITRFRGGGVLLRYLPPGARAGDAAWAFPRVWTTPALDRLALVRATTTAPGAITRLLPGGGIVVSSRFQQTDVTFIPPDEDLEVGVFDPRPGRALQLVKRGGLRGVTGGSS